MRVSTPKPSALRTSGSFASTWSKLPFTVFRIPISAMAFLRTVRAYSRGSGARQPRRGARTGHTPARSRVGAERLEAHPERDAQIEEGLLRDEPARRRHRATELRQREIEPELPTRVAEVHRRERLQP